MTTRRWRDVWLRRAPDPGIEDAANKLRSVEADDERVDALASELHARLKRNRFGAQIDAALHLRRRR